MKKLFLIALLAGFALRGAATNYIVYVANYTFSPREIKDVHPGDVITWTWQSGVHTTTSTMIPKNAPGWNANIDGGNLTFSYTVPNIAGTYHYQCNVNPTMVTGSFAVVKEAGVTAATNNTSISCNPNPASDKLHIVFGNISATTSLSIFDVTGKQVLHYGYAAKEADIDVSALPCGTYFIKAQDIGGAFITERIEILR